MQRIAALFKHNFIFKLISVAIAFIIWIMVVNISNPEITETVTSEIEVLYADELLNAGKTYTIDADTVRISYKVRSNYRRLIHPSNFKVYIDLRDYSITGAVPVYVEADDTISGYVSNITQSPMVAHVDTEDMVETPFAVTAYTAGAPADGMVAGPVTLSSDEVTVYGPVSDVDRIETAAVTVDISGASSDFAGTAQPVFYDSDGNVLELGEKTVIRTDINYTAAIYSTKKISINASVEGLPAEGYYVERLDISPRSISVCGPQEIMDSVNSINLPESAVDVDGATRNVTVSLNVSELIPEGLALTESGEVTVVAVIAAEQPAETETTAESEAAGPGASESVTEVITDGAEETSAEETESEVQPSFESTESSAAESSEAENAEGHTTDTSGPSDEN